MTKAEREMAMNALNQFMRTAADLHIASKDCGADSIDVSAVVDGKRYVVSIKQVDVDDEWSDDDD